MKYHLINKFIIERKFLHTIIRYEKKIIIYGAGIIGMRTWNWLRENGLQDRVICFAVTSGKNNEMEIEGIPVREINELGALKSKALIIVAVSGVGQNEILHTLGKLRFENILAINPKINEKVLKVVEQNKKKNLYICTTYYHALISITKIITLNHRADVFLAFAMGNKFELGNRLLESGYVENVFYCDFRNMIEQNHKNKLIDKLISRRINIRNFEREVTVDFRRYQDIYVFSYSNAIDHYLQSKKIMHCLLEDALDWFKVVSQSKNQYMDYWNSKKFVFDWILGLGYQDVGQSKYSKAIEVNGIEGVKIPNVNRNKLIECSRKKMFSKLNEEDIVTITKIFMGDNQIEIGSSEKSVLILTTPLNELNKTMIEHGVIFKNIIDKAQQEYENIYVKPHPRDEFPYDELEGIKVIERKLPIEILNFYGKILFDKAITIGSAAIYGIDFVREKEILGFEYVEQFLDYK